MVSLLEERFCVQFIKRIGKIDTIGTSGSVIIFRRLRALSVSVDGFGDFASTSWGFGNKSDLEIDG